MPCASRMKARLELGNPDPSWGTSLLPLGADFPQSPPESSDGGKASHCPQLPRTQTFPCQLLMPFLPGMPGGTCFPNEDALLTLLAWGLLTSLVLLPGSPADRSGNCFHPSWWYSCNRTCTISSSFYLTTVINGTRAQCCAGNPWCSISAYQIIINSNFKKKEIRGKIAPDWHLYVCIWGP